MPSDGPRAVRVPDHDDVDRARQTLTELLEPTPLLVDQVGAGPVLKLETCQPTGAFKVRGALNALSQLPTEVPVVAASAGNHGLGLAYAARQLGRRVTIVVPGTAAAPKVAALHALDADLLQVGTSYDDAEARAAELAAQGSHLVSAYNDPDVIAGQATIGAELEASLAGPLTVVCGLGGGGLASGLGLWASENDDVRVVGVETAASLAMSSTIAAGHDVQVEVSPTLADGLEGNLEAGSVTVGLVAAHVDTLTTVTEAEIRVALRYLAGRYGVVAEGAAAAPVAAVLAGKVPAHGQVVAVVSGRNIDLAAYAHILATTD